MRSIGVLLVRLTIGGLLVGHGGQKLFGWFGGPGLEGTTGWLESLRLRPAIVWARMAGAAELGGGLLTALGFLNPLGPIAAIGAMTMAWAKVHLGKPIWVTKGGAELPLTNLAALSAIALAGPGRLSVDGLLGIRVPRRIGFLALGGVAASLWYGARPEIQRVAAEALDAVGMESGAGVPESIELASVSVDPDAVPEDPDPVPPEPDAPSSDPDLAFAAPEPIPEAPRVWVVTDQS